MTMRLHHGVIAVGLLGLTLLGGAELVLRVYPRLLPEEAALRLFWRDLVDQGGLKSIASDEVAYLMPSQVQDQIAAGRLAFTFTTDRNGFRNPAWPEQADLVILGDSQAFGFGVDDEQTWVRQLDRLMPDQTIVNLGILGAAPQQYLLAYEAFGRALESKRVMVTLYPPNALLAVEDFDAWVAAGRPARFDEWRMKGFRGNLLKQLLLRSYLFNVLYFIRQPGHTVRFDDGGYVRLAPAEVAPFVDRAQQGHPTFERVIAFLQRLQAQTAAAGAEFLVLVMPSKWEALAPRLAAAPPVPDLVAPFVARFEQAGMPYLDLTPLLARQAALGVRLFLEVDIHLNVAGNQFIAKTLADHLAASTPAWAPGPSMAHQL